MPLAAPMLRKRMPPIFSRVTLVWSISSPSLLKKIKLSLKEMGMSLTWNLKGVPIQVRASRSPTLEQPSCSQKNDDLTQKLAEKEELEKQLRIKLEKASEVEVNLLLQIKMLTGRQMEMERVEKQLEQWQELHEELAGNSSRFSFQKISHDDDLVRFYTGLPCAEAFESQCR